MTISTIAPIAAGGSETPAVITHIGMIAAAISSDERDGGGDEEHSVSCILIWGANAAPRIARSSAAEIAVDRRVRAAAQDFSCGGPTARTRPSRDEGHQIGRVADVLRRVDRDEHRQPFVAPQLVDQRDHLAPQARVEPAERLVEQHQRPLAHQRAGDRDTLALAAGQLGRAPPAEAGKPHALERLLDAAPARRVEPQPRIDAEPDILRAVRCGKRLWSWKSIESGRSAGLSGMRSRPAKRSVPDVGVSKPAMAWRSVVLPPPDGPISPQSAPAGTVSV